MSLLQFLYRSSECICVIMSKPCATALKEYECKNCICCCWDFHCCLRKWNCSVLLILIMIIIIMNDNNKRVVITGHEKELTQNAHALVWMSE